MALEILLAIAFFWFLFWLLSRLLRSGFRDSYHLAIILAPAGLVAGAIAVASLTLLSWFATGEWNWLKLSEAFDWLNVSPLRQAKFFGQTSWVGINRLNQALLEGSLAIALVWSALITMLSFGIHMLIEELIVGED